jgi:hypothetical protein
MDANDNSIDSGIGKQFAVIRINPGHIAAVSDLPEETWARVGNRDDFGTRLGHEGRQMHDLGNETGAYDANTNPVPVVVAIHGR